MKMLGLAYNQGGIINFLGKQPEVTAPVRAQSHADSPPTQLAYITDAEKDLLVKANIHGSMDGQPNQGPAGLESLDDWYNVPGGGVSGGSGENVFSSGVDTGGGGGGGGGGGSGGYQSSEAYGIGAGQAVGGQNMDTVFTQTGGPPGTQQGWAKDEAATLAAQQAAEKRAVEEAKKAAEEAAAEAERVRLEKEQNKKQGIISKYLHGEVLDDYVGDKNWVTPKGQHKLRSQLDRLTAKYGEDFLDTEQAKVLMNYLSGVAVERGGGLGARTEETDAELIGPTNVEDIPMYDPVTGEYRSPEERQALAEAAQYRLDALNKFAGIGGLDAAEGATSTAAYLKGLDPKQLRLGLSPDQYFQFRQQLMAADPTAGNQLYKDTFPWSSSSGVSKLATPMMSILKEAGQGLSGLIPQDAKTMGKDLFGNFGNIFGTKPEWADWRANQRIFEDTSTPVYGQNNQMDRREPSWWNTGGESQPVEDENENENENENDAVNLTPTPTPFPTYGTGIAGLDWASLAPQFGPQYPGHYLNQGIQPNFANWYDNLNKYYG